MKADLLVEIGTEELPASRVHDAAKALRDGLAAGLADAGLLDRIVAESQPVLGTPRRLAAFLPGVAERQESREERFWGPPVAAAFGPDGKATKAGEGFARSSGVPLEKMGRGEKVPGKPPYLFADRTVEGRTAAAVIAEILPQVVKALPFKRTMRWPQSTDFAFVRPIRNLVVLLGTKVVNVTLAGVKASQKTRGHRFLSPKTITLKSASVEAYVEVLRENMVLVDWQERRGVVFRSVQDARTSYGADVSQSTVPALMESVQEQSSLIPEVCGLVEWPGLVIGGFDGPYLGLPRPVLVTAMTHHLRFFPMVSNDKGVLPHFISITDRGGQDSEGIRRGNERVLRARLYDALFFYDNDCKRTLESRRAETGKVDYHRSLGTLLDKSERVVGVANAICDRLPVDQDIRSMVVQAARLLKCDLLTEVVGEFPELQGVMGRHYAERDQVPGDVALAIEAQYRAPGLPLESLLRRSPVVSILCAADKAETLASYFSVGEEPTGSADPFGLRRAALGLLDAISASPLAPNMSVVEVISPALERFGVPDSVREKLHAFIWTRASQLARLREYGDFVESVKLPRGMGYYQYFARLDALKNLSADPKWPYLIALVERTGNMGQVAVPSGRLGGVQLPAEALAVYEGLKKARETAARERDPHLFALMYLDALGRPVQELFEKVLVDDPAKPEQSAAIKHILYDVYALFADRLGDLRKLGSGAKPPRA